MYSEYLFHSIPRRCIIVVAWHSLVSLSIVLFEWNSPVRITFTALQFVRECTTFSDIPLEFWYLKWVLLQWKSHSPPCEGVTCSISPVYGSWMHSFFQIPLFVHIKFFNQNYLLYLEFFVNVQPSPNSPPGFYLWIEFVSNFTFSVRNVRECTTFSNFSIQFLLIWTECSNKKHIQFKFSFVARLGLCGRFHNNDSVYRGLIKCRFE